MTETELKVKMKFLGINGNAYAVMGAFEKAAKQQGFTEEQIKPILEEAISDDYAHLLATILKHIEM